MSSKSEVERQDNSLNLPLELLEKNRPQQQRAIRTYESILEAAAQLLEEIGVERISTNLIAERANITVPALYRYFPNKYAVIYTLGARLMDRHNEILSVWFCNTRCRKAPLTDAANYCELLKDIQHITKTQTAGIFVLRAMRALPLLQDARLQSHYAATDWVSQQFESVLGVKVSENTRLKIRLMMEVGTSIIEMTMEDPQMSASLALKEGGRLQSLYAQEILNDFQTATQQAQ